MNGQSYITIIGNVFVDIKGGAFRPVHKDAKNVGTVQIVHGGVGRNAAHNLAVLGGNVRFVSSLSEGGLGTEVGAVLRALGVDTSYIKSFPQNGMGVWLAVLQPDGDLVASISEQPDRRHQEEAVFSALQEYVGQASIVGLDVGITKNVNERVIAACRSANVPVFGVVGNLDVVERHPETLAGLDGFVCNAEEAALLAGCPVTTPAEAAHAAAQIADLGCGAVVVTLAEAGSVVRTQHEVSHLPAESVEVVDSTGAGDSFFAGLLYALADGQSVMDAARFAGRVAGRVVASRSNTLTTGDFAGGVSVEA